MVGIKTAKENGHLVDYKFDNPLGDGTYAISGGIAFPRMHDVGIKPKGAIVIIGELDGIYYELDEFEFSEQLNADIKDCYKRTLNRRFFFSDSGTERARLAISRDKSITWRPDFVRAPYAHIDEAKHEFYSLILEGRLKMQPNGLLYTATQNMGFQKTNPVLTATFNAITGLLKYPRRRS